MGAGEATATPHPIHAAALLLATGCFYRIEPESRICEDWAYAISERTLVCTDDADAANARYDVITDQTECLLSDEVDQPYNPNGILPADDDPDGNARLDRLYDCVRAARQADCADVDTRGDDPTYWLALDPACAEVATAAGLGADTGTTP